MSHHLQFYIDGAWVEPLEPRTLAVIDPSTEEACARISLGSSADVDRAVAAARRAFESFGASPVAERVALLHRIIEIYERRAEDLARAVSMEMGAPYQFALEDQVGSGLAHLKKIAAVLADYQFEERRKTGLIVQEPIGVVGLITPWNWPLNQITCKIGPALAAGCTMVLKPSEIAPLDAIIIAEILDEAGVPAGVFNLVNGDGPGVGAAISSHPDIDMVSFTGSTRAGILVAKAAADTVKRVCQELGGKSPNILLPDADFPAAVARGVMNCMENSGQSCNAPTCMMVPLDRHAEVVEIARRTAETIKVGPAAAADSQLGPVVSQLQFDKIQDLIQSGIDEGATLVTGGVGRPDGLNRGFFVRPTVFADVRPGMRIEREEIFGPVLSIMPYDTVEQVLGMANDTPYGLAAYIQSSDIDNARKLARRLRTGTVGINYPRWSAGMPFGGYKQSGNGREYAEFGLHDFIEIKGISGFWPED